MKYRIGTIVENSQGVYVIEGADYELDTFKLAPVKFTKGLGYTSTVGAGYYVGINTLTNDFEYVAQTSRSWVVDVQESMKGLRK